MPLFNPYITTYDYLLLPVYAIIVFFIGLKIKNRFIQTNSAYRFFLPGLIIKVLGAVSFSVIYVYYYGGGDTTAYLRGSKALINLFFTDVSAAFHIFLGNYETTDFFKFTANTGYPPFYMFKDPGTYAVSRFSLPFVFFGFGRMLPSVILLSSFSYIGLWLFYKMILKLFNFNHKILAFSILFVPSAIFWGSGIMKDTFTFAAFLWSMVNIYQIFIRKKNIAGNLFLLILNSFVVITIKPYIFVALIPTAFIWIIGKNVKNISNNILKYSFLPLLILFGFSFSLILLNVFSEPLEQYGDIDSMISQAQIIQQDLIRAEQYGQNFYNIGDYDPSISGMLSKFFPAIIAGLFRPFLWEAGNILMLISGLENFIILFLTLYTIIKVRLKIIRYLTNDSLLMSLFIFSLIFAFSIGISSANFGALVRYKIPLLPIYIPMLVIILMKHKREETSISLEEK